MNRSLLPAGVGIGLLVYAFVLYIVGMGGAIDFFILKMAYVAAILGVTTLWISLLTTIEDATFSDPIFLGGVVTTIIALGWLFLHYPHNWDTAAPQSAASVIGAGLFTLGQAGLLYPSLTALIRQSDDTDRQYYIGLGCFGLSAATILTALSLYAYCQLTPGNYLGLRRFVAISTGFGLSLLPFGLTRFIHRSRYTEIASLGCWAALVIPLLAAVLAPQYLHTNTTSIGDLTIMFISGIFPLIGLSGLFGMTITATSTTVDSSFTYIHEWIRRMLFNEDENRPRTPVRILMGLLIMILLNIAVVLVVVPLGTGLSVVTGIPFKIAENPVQNTFIEYLVRATAWGVVYPLTAYIAYKYIDNRDPIRLWLNGDKLEFSPLYFVVSFLIGAVAATITILINVQFEWMTLHLRSTPITSLTIGSVLLGLLVTGGFAIGNVVFYGMWFGQNTAEGLRKYVPGKIGVLVGLFVAVLIYTFISPYTVLTQHSPTTALIWAGFFVSIMYSSLHFGRASIPIGIWWGWSGMLTIVFGTRVIRQFNSSLFEVTVTGPVLYTGGHFGPTGSLVGTLVLLTIALLTYDLALVTGKAPSPHIAATTQTPSSDTDE